MRRAPRHMAATGTVPPPADLQLLQRLRGDCDIVALECCRAALSETATAFALRRAGPGSSVLAQARCAPEETQTLWLTYLWRLCRKTDRTALTSAWQA